LHLWSSGNLLEGEIFIKSAKENSGLYNYKSIELASNFSIDEFYANFRQKEGAACITTKAEKWWQSVETLVPTSYNTLTPTSATPDPFLETVIPAP